MRHATETTILPISEFFTFFIQDINIFSNCLFIYNVYFLYVKSFHVRYIRTKNYQFNVKVKIYMIKSINRLYFIERMLYFWGLLTCPTFSGCIQDFSFLFKIFFSSIYYFSNIYGGLERSDFYYQIEFYSKFKLYLFTYNI